jgi:hypothetical protein
MKSFLHRKAGSLSSNEKLSLRFLNYFTLPRLANLFIIFSVVFVFANYNRWRSKESIIRSDVLVYYQYLPAAIIFHDLTFNFMDNYKGALHFDFCLDKATNGAKIVKTSMGMALMYFPFFLMAHAGAYLFGYDMGGYSMPYQAGIILSVLFYLVLGLHYLRKILERWFDSFTVALTTLLIVFATNLFYYASMEGPMSHVYSFSLFCVIIYHTLLWYEKQSVRNTLVIGLALGALVLIRPTNIIMFLFFIFYDVKSWKEFYARVLLLLKKFPLMLMIMFCVIIFWIPQCIYWKSITGQWFYYSYGNEHFFFTRPQFIKGLFSFRKGWFIYTPLMMFAIAGMIMSYRHLKSFFLPFVIIILLNSWIAFSWWCWWYGGGYGQREMVDIYGLMAIGLAVMISYLLKTKKILIRLPAFVLIMLLMFLTVFNNVQYVHGGIDCHAMSKEAYFENFGHMEPYGDFWDLLQCPDYDKAKLGIQDTVTCKR